MFIFVDIPYLQKVINIITHALLTSANIPYIFTVTKASSSGLINIYKIRCLENPSGKLYQSYLKLTI